MLYYVLNPTFATGAEGAEELLPLRHQRLPLRADGHTGM
jgi:hypothetical protein